MSEKIGNLSIGYVDSFKYLLLTINNRNSDDEEILMKLSNANRRLREACKKFMSVKFFPTKYSYKKQLSNLF